MTNHRDPTPTEPLSPAGIARKHAMLTELESAVRSRGRRRTARHAALMLAPCLVAAAALAMLRAGHGKGVHQPEPRVLARDASPEPHPPTPQPPAGPETPTMPEVRMVYVDRDRAVLDRYTAPATQARVDRISDRELLDELKQFGLPAGMVKTDTRATLAFHNVPPLEPARTP